MGAVSIDNKKKFFMQIFKKFHWAGINLFSVDSLSVLPPFYCFWILLHLTDFTPWFQQRQRQNQQISQISCRMKVCVACLTEPV